MEKVYLNLQEKRRNRKWGYRAKEVARHGLLRYPLKVLINLPKKHCSRMVTTFTLEDYVMRIVSLTVIVGLFVACKPAVRQPVSELENVLLSRLARAVKRAEDVGHLDVAKYLRSYIENNEGSSISAISVIKGAIKEKRFDVAKHLVHDIRHSINNYMIRAARKGDLDVVKFLRGEGAGHINQGMLEAARNRHLGVVEFLIREGAHQINTAMREAARKGDLDVVKFLRGEGSDLLNSGMLEAARNGHLDVVKFLRGEGAGRLNDAMEAASEGDHLEVIKYLKSEIEKGS